MINERFLVCAVEGVERPVALAEADPRVQERWGRDVPCQPQRFGFADYLLRLLLRAGLPYAAAREASDVALRSDGDRPLEHFNRFVEVRCLGRLRLWTADSPLATATTELGIAYG